MTATASLPSVVLYCTEGGSDKEYHAAVERDARGFRVTFAYGRRGSTLKPGVKIEGATLDAANQCWTKLVNEKMAKGYIPSPLHTDKPAPYVSPAGNTRTSESIAVQLLEATDDPARYLDNPRWVAQPKYDGIRLLLRIDSRANVTAQNKKGLDRGFPKVFVQGMKDLAFRRLWEKDSAAEIILDGEAVGERFFAFDLLKLDGQDLRSHTYDSRLALLEALFGASVPASSPLQLGLTARSAIAKRVMLEELRKAGAEGAVFKSLDAKYVGRRTELAIKLKFWQSATVLVIARNDTGAVLNGGEAKVPANKPDGHRSIQCAMVDPDAGPGELEGALVFVGDVTIPVNREVPEPGTFAEIKYLYAHPSSRKMYQAQIISVRDDVDLSDCMISQLKMKQGESD